MDAEQERMIATHMGLAQSLAMQQWRTAPHALDLDDLRSVAYLALVGCADRWRPYCREKQFDPNALEYFKPFVVRRVYGALIDYIRSSDWATRSLRTRAKALQEAGQDRGVPQPELARRTGMTLTEVRNTVRGMAQRPVSLEAEEIDPKTSTDVESSAFTRTVLDSVVDVIRDLPAEQQTVIALHYWRGLQLQEVARTMAITESRASQLHAKAVLTVHEVMKTAAENEAG